MSQHAEPAATPVTAARPLHDRLFVRRLAETEKSKGGIIIPDTAKEKRVEGIVLQVGPGKTMPSGNRRKLDVVEGDRVLFGEWAGTETKVAGQTILILKEDDVLGVLLDEGKRIRPLRDKLLVKRVKDEKKIGSIIIPDEYIERANEGVVIAAGPGAWDDWVGGTGEARMAMAVTVGDYVHWGKHSGDAYKVDGGKAGEHLILRDEDVLAVDDSKKGATL